MNPLSYIKLGLGALAIAAAIALWLYVDGLKTARDEALAQVASLSATNNELAAVHANDAKALAELKAATTAAEAARVADAATQHVIRDSVVQWKEKVIHVPVASRSCSAASARDLAALAGVRGILAGTAAPDPNSGGQGATAPGADRGHPAARGVGSADNTG